MRNLTRSVLCAGLAAVIGAAGCLTRGSKEWIKQEISQHEKRPLKLLAEAFNSTYQVINESYYETREGKMIRGIDNSGSSILLNGGYLLTAEHVVDENFPWQFSDNYWGSVRYHHNKLSIKDKDSSCGLEMILTDLDIGYALLKLSEEDSKDLPFYSPGLNNIPEKIKLGMRSAAIGYRLGTGRNLRLGNVSQIGSGKDENHLRFSNIIIHDSGGPIFVLEDSDIKFAAIAAKPSFGLKVKAILKDMEEQLELELLDEEVSEEVKNFLKLNKNISEN